jgi:hypothetical protein
MNVSVREQHRLRVFHNVMLRIIFWHLREAVTRDRGKLHHEKLHDMYTSPNFVLVIKSRTRWAQQLAHMGEKHAHRSLEGKPVGKKPLGRLKHRWNTLKWTLKK